MGGLEIFEIIDWLFREDASSANGSLSPRSSWNDSGKRRSNDCK
jgi:hypothetical protein